MGPSPRLFTVGPVQLRSDILAIGSQQPPYFRTAEFSEMNGQICRSLKQLVHADDGSEVVLLTASGTGAMEAAVINAFSTNDKVLVVVGGTFGRDSSRSVLFTRSGTQRSVWRMEKPSRETCWTHTDLRDSQAC